VEPETSLDSDIAAAVERCAEFAHMIAELIATTMTSRRSEDSALAAKAQRALASATFAQTTPERAITAAAKQVAMTVKKRGTALEEGVAATFDIFLAIIRLQALRDAEDVRLAEKSRDLGVAGIPIEAQRLVWKLLEQGVAPSMFDLLTAPELCVMARLLWEKNEDYKHRGPGLWMAIWRSGVVDFPVKGLSADEALAVRAMSDDEEGLEARRFIEEVAGRKLDISPMLALQLVRNHRATEKSRGLRLTHAQIAGDDIDGDIEFIVDVLGLGERDRDHADEIWHRIFGLRLAKFDQRRAEEAASRETRIEFYLPLARQVHAHRARKSEEWHARHPLQTEDDADEESTTGVDAFDAISAGAIDLDADGQANPKRSHMPEADRLRYEEAIARVEDFQDREVAAQIADSEQYRTWLRRQGFDVPEPPTWNEADDNSSSPVAAEDLAKDAQRHDSDQTSNSRTPAAVVPATQKPSIATQPSTVGGLSPAVSSRFG
jgi:hypothetical protein